MTEVNGPLDLEKAPLEGVTAKLSATKSRLLSQRLRGVGQNSEPQIQPRTPGTRVPLSAEQRQIWIHALQVPELPIYNEPVTIIKYGRFDLRVFEASFNEVLRRHEAWRTSISPEGEQIVRNHLDISLALIDLSDLPLPQREAEALRIATEDAQSPIPVWSFPLFRAKVVRFKLDEHRIYLTFHHIVFDGFSIERIFVPELSAIYKAFENGEPSSLPEQKIQYGDYALWREKHVDTTSVKKHHDWWLNQLSGELPSLRLSEQNHPSAFTDHRGGMYRLPIPVSLEKGLHELSSRYGVTIYVTLLSVFQVLLFRYSGQGDLIIGTAGDARRRIELERVIGYFLDTFVVRTRPSPNLKFSQYLSETRDSVLGGLTAADAPFDRVVQELNPQREHGRHPLFQVFFTMRPPKQSFDDGWATSPSDVTVGANKFDIYLEVIDYPGKMEARFMYRKSMWDSSSIERMAAHWQILLNSIVNSPDATLGSLDILTPNETANLLGSGGWNDTARAFPHLTLSALIERQTQRTPGNIAAVFKNESLTYTQLNERANKLAGRLIANDVKRGSVVAIALERSLDLLVSLIAVMKTGAAYLPLDIHVPSQRMSRYLSQSQPSIILTQSSLLPLVSVSTAPTLLVDQNETQTVVESEHSTDNHSDPIAADPDDTAYLIYTSGTTGEPKAVEISQFSLVNLLASMQVSPGFNSEDILLAITPISFDIAALELFLPIISGGTVVIASREEARDPILLASAIRRSHCTVIQATPSTWRMLLNAGWANGLLDSKSDSPKPIRILCGGEALPRELANQLLATGADLWNMYGPTETTIWSLIERVHPNPQQEPGSVSVGGPIANTTAFILDSQLRPQPIGVAGEIFLGGLGLAKGYRGDPKQTAERFISVDSLDGRRLYRTGDVGVRRPNGSIQVFGRTDNQVKIRGIRIELEAIEAAVLEHPSVAAAAARTWPEQTGDSRLSVYIVNREGVPSPSLIEMKNFLAKILPESMIPSDIVSLPAIPLTPHGKINRQLLPAPSIEERRNQKEMLTSSEEVRLGAIWSDLLKTKEIGPFDNFFELGGHSILVAALQQQIFSQFRLRIPMAELFQSPTVSKQAQLIERAINGKALLPPGVVAIQPDGTRKRLFWIHSLGVRISKGFGQDQPFYSVSLTEADMHSLEEAPDLQSIASKLVQKITATQPYGPYVLGGFCLGGVLAYEVASQLIASGREVSLLALIDSPNPTQLDSDRPLIRKLFYISYGLKRFSRIGLKLSAIYVAEHLRRYIRRITGIKLPRTEMRIAQEKIEAAALAYRPQRYEGAALLVIASERPPHMNLLPGWQDVIAHNLHVRYVDGHHRDLLDTRNVKTVANAVTSLMDL